jgi:hypothetical protein
LLFLFSAQQQVGELLFTRVAAAVKKKKKKLRWINIFPLWARTFFNKSKIRLLFPNLFLFFDLITDGMLSLPTHVQHAYVWPSHTRSVINIPLCHHSMLEEKRREDR